MSVLDVRGKVDLVADYLRTWPRPVLVETGLWEGWGTTMRLPAELLDQVDRHVLIDIDAGNCGKASAWADDRRPLGGVEVLCGDSANLLADSLLVERRNALVWLDAHNDDDGPQPLAHELAFMVGRAIQGFRDVVLIDDLRMMGAGWPGTPSLERLRRMAEWGGWDCAEANDVMRLTPRGR